jgi:hypothetical protein
MSATKIDRRTAYADVAATRNDVLIARAARRAGWAASALDSAAADLEAAHDREGNPLTSLAEVVSEGAARVSHMAADIESRRATSTERTGPCR